MFTKSKRSLLLLPFAFKNRICLCAHFIDSVVIIVEACTIISNIVSALFPKVDKVFYKKPDTKMDYPITLRCLRLIAFVFVEIWVELCERLIVLYLVGLA